MLHGTRNRSVRDSPGKRRQECEVSEKSCSGGFLTFILNF